MGQSHMDYRNVAPSALAWHRSRAEFGPILPLQSFLGAIMETATFGAGCFWGVEETFRQIPGVLDTAVGYLGGHTQNPTYQDVCTDETGHAEVAQVTYDPAKDTYVRLLTVFWESNDPTTITGKGPDTGTQYRPAILFHSPEQERFARPWKEKMQASGRFGRPPVTEITPASTFYRAEDY